MPRGNSASSCWRRRKGSACFCHGPVGAWPGRRWSADVRRQMAGSEPGHDGAGCWPTITISGRVAIRRPGRGRWAWQTVRHRHRSRDRVSIETMSARGRSCRLAATGHWLASTSEPDSGSKDSNTEKQARTTECTEIKNYHASRRCAITHRAKRPNAFLLCALCGPRRFLCVKKSFLAFCL